MPASAGVAGICLLLAGPARAQAPRPALYPAPPSTPRSIPAGGTAARQPAPAAQPPNGTGIIVLDDSTPASAGSQGQPDIIVVPPAQTPFAKKPLGKLDLKSLIQLEKRVLRDTSQLRGLPIKRPVPVGIADGKSIAALMESVEREDHARSQILATEIYMRQLDLAPANFDFRRAIGSAMDEQLAGYYSPKDKKFFLTQNCAPAEAEMVMSHELTHALQDQNFNLLRLKASVPNNSDARLAMACVFEGDATYNMAHYLAAVNPALIPTMLASQSSHDSTALHAIPHYLSDSIVFPYRAGLIFMKDLSQNGVSPDRAFTHLPKSTEQILHLDKYASDEKPVSLTLPPLAAQLGAGWQFVDQDVNGEYGLGLALADQLGPQPSSDAAVGWGGDKCAIYSGPRGGALVVQDTVWDSTAAALKWAQAYAATANMRFPNSLTTRGKLQIWNNGKKGVWMASEGRRVFILEGTVGSFQPEKIFAACQFKL